MMVDADKTWALIVGVDVYQGADIVPLSSPVSDAVAFIKLLQRLGIPDTQIMLHAAPGPKGTQALSTVPTITPKDATKAKIEESANALNAVTGKRLVIYLSGHGLYIPDKGRIFLPEDFNIFSRNIGIDEYIKFFLSCNFSEQYLFLDGCQNYPLPINMRVPITPQGLGGHDPIPLPSNRLSSLLAAKQSQLAVEDVASGRSVMTKYLLEVLDPTQNAFQEALEFDFLTGVRHINLEAVAKFVIRKVQNEVSSQTPVFKENEGDGAVPDRVYFCELQPGTFPGNTKLSLQIDPQQAVPSVGRLQVTLLQPPVYPNVTLTQATPGISAVQQLYVPKDLDIRAECLLSSQNIWALTYDRFDKRFNTDKDTLVFQCHSSTAAFPPPRNSVQAVTIDRQGRSVDIFYEREYREMASQVGLVVTPEYNSELEPGIIFRHHETGPELAFSDDVAPRARELIILWAEAAKLVASELNVVTGPIEIEIRPKVTKGNFVSQLEFILPQGGANVLAGFLDEVQVVHLRPIGSIIDRKEQSYSLKQLEQERIQELQVGLWRISIELPWGSWEKVVSIESTDIEKIELPKVIGQPPLRVLLFDKVTEPQPFSSIVTILASQETFRPFAIMSGFSSTPAVGGGTAYEEKPGIFIGQLRGLSESIEANTHWLPEYPGNEVASIVFGKQAIQFPVPYISREVPGRLIKSGGLNPRFFYYPIAVSLEKKGVRVEPLVTSNLPEWDLIASVARLDVLTENDIRDLLYEKWNDPLVGLAGAYALQATLGDPKFRNISQNFAREGEHPLITVTNNLRRANLDCVDIDILTATVLGVREVNLGKWSRGQHIPYFRWGVELAINLLDKAEFHLSDETKEWHTRLQEIRARQASTSAWTVWFDTSFIGAE
jgi:Caspase domain